ncbi:MAG TPA: NB-ARC domain-containing protein, partial [Anaerolineaceae bacterium]|nr:NB-ARC domain-containing protein [Anaerolineaceae bacterium]
MGFSINDWKSGIADYFKKHTPKMKQGSMNVFYGLVTAGVLAPAVAAVAQSSGQEVFGQLAALLGGVGVNLVSNLIQQIKDRSEEDAAAEVQRQYEADPELRKALDTLIEKLDAINTAQRTLSDADREWFVQTLREELRQAGSTIINITIIQPDPGVQSLHQLPDPPADFIGRAAELDELCANARSRGVLISGTGGVGKTALGLVLAHRLRDQYPDAQLFLNLQGASDHPLTPAEALERLIRAFEPTARLPETLDELKTIYTSLLQGKRVLVFLDDAMDAAQVRPLLPPQPCLVIVTSRHRLVLASLHATDVEALPPEDADQLICAVWGKTGEVRALAEQCGRLPMALRAVGALLRRRPDLSVAKVQQLLESAAERLKLADPEREATVAAAFQASYDLLDPALQTRWRELGIFPADFDTPAAAAVWGMDGDAGAVLAELYDACLVDYARDRWRLHDLGRDFTRALWTVEEGDALAVRHAFWYFQVLGQASELYQAGGDSVLAGLGLFDRERQNVEAGQAWAAARAGQNREIARLCNAYPAAGVHVISLRLHPRALIAWLEAALAAARNLGDREAEGANLGNLGSAYLNLGEAQKAISYCEQALAIFHRLSNWHGEGA